MMANIYGYYGVNVEETFKNIDKFLEENFDKFEDMNQVLDPESLIKMKILICDLTALDGLNPREIKHRETLIFELLSVINMYYLKNKESQIPSETFFLTP